MANPTVGRLSDDGSLYWDGQRWVSSLSSDGNWQWDGNQWVAAPSPAMQPMVAQHSSPGPGSPYLAPQPVAPPVLVLRPPTNSLAVISLVTGILSWVLCPFAAALAAVITGHLGRSQIKRSGEGGGGLAVAGLVLGYVNVMGSILFAVFWMFLFGGLAVLGLGGAATPNSALATPTSGPCNPQPCANYQGITLYVSNIDRDYHPKDVPSYEQINASPRPGFHFVRLEVTFTVQSGEREIDPLDTVQLKDSLGYQQSGLALDLVDPHCEAPTGATVAAGSKYGPVPLCYEAGGSTSGALTLVWIPSGLTGLQPGVELKLP